MNVSNKNIQTYVLLETVASIYVIYVSYSSYLYDMIIRSNTGTYLIVATVGVVPHMFQIGGYRKKDVYVAKKMIQISHSHKIHRPTMTNGNSSDISICNSIPRFLNSLYNFALQLPIVRHFLHSFVQHSAQLHLIPRFSGSAEKRRRDVAIVHTQEACSYN